MDDKVIFIEDSGQVSEPQATVSPGQKVIWKPRTDGNEISIVFTEKVPFKGLKWLNKKETKKRVIDGTVKKHGAGEHRYEYNTFEPLIETVLEPLSGPLSGPELIVDGGRGVTKKTSKKAKKAKKAKAKAKKTKPVARRSAVKKSMARKSKTKKGKAKKAAKSRASKKR